MSREANKKREREESDNNNNSNIISNCTILMMDMVNCLTRIRNQIRTVTLRHEFIHLTFTYAMRDNLFDQTLKYCH